MALDTGFTAILLHFDGADGGTTFTDESGLSWLRTSATTETDQKKFGTSSGYFPGAAYLYYPDHDNFYIRGDFTSDFWVRFTDFPSAGGYYQFWCHNQDTNNYCTFCFTNVAGVHSLNFEYKTGGVSTINFTKALSSNLSLNTWYHIRLCRAGNNFKFYLNGSKVGTTETSAAVLPNFTGNFYIGAWSGGVSCFVGYMDEFRLVNGKAVVTGDSFIPPVQAYSLQSVDDAYTIHSMHFDGWDARTVVLDQSGIVWSLVGNAQLDTAQKKFGESSLLLDGTGDYLYTVDNALYTLGTQDFCVEMWVRWNALPSASTNQIIWTNRTGDTQRIAFYIYNTAGVYSLRAKYWVGGVEVFGIMRDITVATGTWYHVAWTRESLVHRLFLDGTQLGLSAPDGTSFEDFTGYIYLGTSNGSVEFFNGWIDEYRFSKGTARYTASFTPETAPFGPIIPHSDSLTYIEDHPTIDNTIALNLPQFSVDLDSSWHLHVLDVTLPLLTTSLHGLTGGIGSIDVPLPLFQYNASGIPGNIGNIDLDLPLPESQLYGAGLLDLSLPIFDVNTNLLVGAAGKLNAVLPKLAVEVLSHLDGTGRLNLTLPNLSVYLGGLQHGFGFLAFNLPPLGFSGTGLTGAVGSINLNLPQFQATVHSYHAGLARMDIVLPAMVLNAFGRMIPATVTYKGVVINTKNMSVTEYEGFQFNSLGSAGNVHLGANETGIYAFRGNRQGSGFVESRIKGGSLDFGRSVLTAPKDVWLTMRSNGQLVMTVQSDEGDEYEYDVTGLTTALHEERVKLGRGLKGRHYAFGLKNVEGSDFDLNRLAVMVESLKNRRR
jgi:hypothetical protein